MILDPLVRNISEKHQCWGTKESLISCITLVQQCPYVKDELPKPHFDKVVIIPDGGHVVVKDGGDIFLREDISVIADKK